MLLNYIFEIKCHSPHLHVSIVFPLSITLSLIVLLPLHPRNLLSFYNTIFFRNEKFIQVYMIYIYFFSTKTRDCNQS